MSNVYIKSVEGGENTNPDGTDAIEIDDGTNSEWVKINNLFDGAPTTGDTIYYNGTKWARQATGTGSSKVEGAVINGKISVTVASNNLTVALKTWAGTDPSATDPVRVYISGSERTVTSALSVTVNAGTNTFNAGSETAAQEVDYFAYVGWRAASSAVVLGFGRISHARVYSAFSGTATAETYGAFSTTPAAGDDVTVIARFAATLSAGAGYTWTVPTFTSTNLIQRPVFTTRKLTYTPVVTGFSGSPTVSGSYLINSNVMTFHITVSGTSNATDFTATVPFTLTSSSNDVQRLVDNGAAVAGLAVAAGSTITFYSSVGAGAWTNSGTKGCEALTKTFFI